VYLRVTDPSGDTAVYLIGSKTKLAPMKTISIPRLELSGAVLLALWLSRLHRILALQIVITGIFAWSDSTIVLSWLKNSHRFFKTFVSNRIFQNQSSIPNFHWFHVHSEDNPADCASRGLLPSELGKSHLYWKGPTFLHSSGETWSKDVLSLGLD